MAFDVGVNVQLTVVANSNTYALPAQLRAMSNSFRRGLQPVLAATGGANSLLGYAPSNGAAGGFVLAFAIPYAVKTPTGVGTYGTPANADVLLNDLLVAGVTVDMKLGTAGAITSTSNTARTLVVSGAEGGALTGTVTFDSTDVPLIGAAATPAIGEADGDFYRFGDVTSADVPNLVTTVWSVGTLVDVSSFSYTVQRTLAEFKGNSPTGLAKHLKVVRTECMLDVEYLKVDDKVATAAIGVGAGFVQTGQDSNILVTQASPITTVTPAGAKNFKLVCLAAIQDGPPDQVGDIETYITEHAHLMASIGAYTITHV